MVEYPPGYRSEKRGMGGKTREMNEREWNINPKPVRRRKRQLPPRTQWTTRSKAVEAWIKFFGLAMIIPSFFRPLGALDNVMEERSYQGGSDGQHR
jgi:hypothetical protein